MKKTITLIITTLLCSALLTGCFKSEAVKSAEAAIFAIGEVTIESREAIIQAEKLYNILTDSEKSDVENRLTLVEARETLNTLLEEAAHAKAKEAFEKLNSISDVCEAGMDDVYGAWYFGIYDSDDTKGSLMFLMMSFETPNLSSTQLQEAATSMGYTGYSLVDNWQKCLWVAEKAIEQSGAYDTVKTGLSEVQTMLQELTSVYGDEKYVPKLQEYYAAVTSYADFFTNTTGSFNQLQTTINDYENSILTIKSSVGFLFS